MVLADLPVAETGELDRALADVTVVVERVRLRTGVAALLGVVDGELLVGDEELVSQLLARRQAVVLVGALAGKSGNTDRSGAYQYGMTDFK